MPMTTGGGKTDKPKPDVEKEKFTQDQIKLRFYGSVETEPAKLKAVLEKIEGVTDIAVDDATKTCTFKWSGWWGDMPKLEYLIRKKVASNFVNPAPMVAKLTKDGDTAKLSQVVALTSGVRHHHVFEDWAEIQFDAESADIPALFKKFEESGFAVQPTTHHLVTFGLDGKGKYSELEDELLATEGTLFCDVDPYGNTVTLFVAGKPDAGAIKKAAKNAEWSVKDLKIQ